MEHAAQLAADTTERALRLLQLGTTLHIPQIS
jgi:hypothetical protein